MILAPFLALGLALHPTDPSLGWPEPPEEMIDFLGRRGLCQDYAEPPVRNAFTEERGARLSCATLADEEAGWRRRYASNPDVLRWLDQDPRQFRNPMIVMDVYHGPPVADAQQLTITGMAWQSGIPFRLRADSRVGGGRQTRFTASFAGTPNRTFAIDNRRLPWIDLQSVTVALGRDPPDEELLVMLRYGYRRGYCGDLDLDDRPKITIRFSRTEVSASYQDRVNCRPDYEALPNADSAS